MHPIRSFLSLKYSHRTPAPPRHITPPYPTLAIRSTLYFLFAHPGRLSQLIPVMSTACTASDWLALPYHAPQGGLRPVIGDRLHTVVSWFCPVSLSVQLLILSTFQLTVLKFAVTENENKASPWMSKQVRASNGKL